MTAGTEFSRTDGPGPMPRWLALVLATTATLLAIGALWALAPTDGGTVPALVTSGILVAMLAAVFVVAFIMRAHRGRVLLILGGAMLFVLVVGLLATVTVANAQPPVIYY